MYLFEGERTLMLGFWSSCIPCSVNLKWYMLVPNDINLNFLHVLFVGKQTKERSCGAVFCQPQECPLLRIVWGLWPLHQGLDWWTYRPGNQEVFQWATATAWNARGACWQTSVHRKPNDQLIRGLAGTETSFQCFWNFLLFNETVIFTMKTFASS